MWYEIISFSSFEFLELGETLTSREMEERDSISGYVQLIHLHYMEEKWGEIGMRLMTVTFSLFYPTEE